MIEMRLPEDVAEELRRTVRDAFEANVRRGVWVKERGYGRREEYIPTERDLGGGYIEGNGFNIQYGRRSVHLNSFGELHYMEWSTYFDPVAKKQVDSETNLFNTEALPKAHHIIKLLQR